MNIKRILVMLIASVMMLNMLCTPVFAEGTDAADSSAYDVEIGDTIYYQGEGVVYRGSGGIVTFALLRDLEIAYALASAPYIVLNTPTLWNVTVSGGSGSYDVSARLFRQDLSDDQFADGYGCIEVIDLYAADSGHEFQYTFTKEGRYFWQIYVVDSTGSKMKYNTRIYETYSTADESSNITVAGKVNEIIASEIDPGMSDYERALVLHDWLIYNANYDYTYTYYDAAGVLLYGKGVCDSYARAYLMLLTAAGIDCMIVTGKAGSDSDPAEWGSHGWNLVKLNGKWYHVDCTWDDPGEGGYERHTYFCVSDETIAKDHLWNNADDTTVDEGLVVPTAPGGELENDGSAMDYDISFTTIDELDAAFDAEIAAGNFRETTVFLYTGNEDHSVISAAYKEWYNEKTDEIFDSGLATWAGYGWNGFYFSVSFGWVDPDDYVRIGETNLCITEGDTVTVYPTEYYPESNAFTWTSSDASVVTVSAGYSASDGLTAKVTGVSEGSATITVTSADGLSDSFTVTVLPVFEPDFELGYDEFSDGITLTWKLIPGVTEYRVMCASADGVTELGTTSVSEYFIDKSRFPGGSFELYVIGERRVNGAVTATYTSSRIIYGDYEFETTLPMGLLSIEADAFAGNSALKSVYIHEGLTGIGAEAFKNCANLEAIRIPGTCGYIGAGAFDGTGLKFAYVYRDGYADSWFKENMPEVTLIYK